MRYAFTFIIFYGLASVVHAQTSAATTVLAPESLSTNKLPSGSAEARVKAATTFIGETSMRRASPSAVKATEQQADEPGSLRMLAAAVLFMLVIALRRNRSGRP